MRRLVLLCLFTLAVSSPAWGQACEPTPQNHAVRITGQAMQGTPVADFPEVSDDRNFYQTLDNGWVFALMRAETCTGRQTRAISLAGTFVMLPTPRRIQVT